MEQIAVRPVSRGPEKQTNKNKTKEKNLNSRPSVLSRFLLHIHVWRPNHPQTDAHAGKGRGQKRKV